MTLALLRFILLMAYSRQRLRLRLYLHLQQSYIHDDYFASPHYRCEPIVIIMMHCKAKDEDFSVLMLMTWLLSAYIELAINVTATLYVCSEF